MGEWVGKIGDMQNADCRNVFINYVEKKRKQNT